MESGVRFLLGPSRRRWAFWAAALTVLWMVGAGLSWRGFFVTVGLVMIAVAWNRDLDQRGLRPTEQDVVIANSAETHIVPKAGATAAVVDEEWNLYRFSQKPAWDNTVTATRRLYVIPGDPGRERIKVEAAQGPIPRRMRVVAKELGSAFQEAS